MRISVWLGRENEENMAWTRNCCGWPSSPPGSYYLKKLCSMTIRTSREKHRICYFLNSFLLKINKITSLNRLNLNANSISVELFSFGFLNCI